jgi:hypothetical protein
MNKIAFSAIASLAFTSMPAFAKEESQQSRVDVGAGVGIPYGLIGIGAEYFVSNNLSLSAGAGHFESFAYSVGANIYFWSSPDRYCPLISINYGTVDQQEGHAGGSLYPATGDDSFEAVSVGIGFKKLWGKDKRDGAMFMIHYVTEDAVGYNVQVVPSIGYMHRF